MPTLYVVVKAFSLRIHHAEPADLQYLLDWREILPACRQKDWYYFAEGEKILVPDDASDLTHTRSEQIGLVMRVVKPRREVIERLEADGYFVLA